MISNLYKHAAAGLGTATLLAALTLTSPAQGQRRLARLTTLRAGTVFAVKLNEGLNSKDAQQGDKFTATVTTPDADANSPALPIGTQVTGVIRSVQAQQDKEPGKLDLDFTRVTLPGGRSYAISGSPYGLDSKSVIHRNGQLVAKPGSKGPSRLSYVGIGAGAGLLVNVLTHRKGTLLDTLLGAGLGYGAGSLIKNGSSPRDVQLKAGDKLGVRLDRSVAISR